MLQDAIAQLVCRKWVRRYQCPNPGLCMICTSFFFSKLWHWKWNLSIVLFGCRFVMTPFDHDTSSHLSRVAIGCWQNFANGNTFTRLAVTIGYKHPEMTSIPTNLNYAHTLTIHDQCRRSRKRSAFFHAVLGDQSSLTCIESSLRELYIFQCQIAAILSVKKRVVEIPEVVNRRKAVSRAVERHRCVDNGER